MDYQDILGNDTAACEIGNSKGSDFACRRRPFAVVIKGWLEQGDT